jgi:phage FluMu protein Com
VSLREKTTMNTELIVEAFRCRLCGRVTVTTEDTAPIEEICPLCDSPAARAELKQALKEEAEEENDSDCCPYHRAIKFI